MADIRRPMRFSGGDMPVRKIRMAMSASRRPRSSASALVMMSSSMPGYSSAKRASLGIRTYRPVALRHPVAFGRTVEEPRAEGTLEIVEAARDR